ncbi:MAG: hypothetical protein ABIJ97_02225, partial [Bacteroidota bacterium]
ASAVVRIEDEAYGSGVPEYDRNSWWDLITSSKNHKFFINANSNDGVNNNNVLTMTETGKVGIGTNEVYEKFQIGDDWTFHQDGSYAIARNFKYDGTTKRIGAGEVSMIKFEEYGDIQIQTAGNGDADSEITTWNYSLCVKNNGNVGIGTFSPSEALEINGKLKITDAWRGIQLDDSGQGGHRFDFIVSHDNTIGTNGGFGIADKTASDVYRLTITNDGNVGIGTSYPQNELDVNGVIRCKEYIVELDNWFDNVFETDYKLMPLNQLSEFVLTNRHLPDIPTEAEVLNNGVEMGNFNALLLKKIEELTLYIIFLEKRISEIENK